MTLDCVFPERAVKGRFFFVLSIFAIFSDSAYFMPGFLFLSFFVKNVSMGNVFSEKSLEIIGK